MIPQRHPDLLSQYPPLTATDRNALRRAIALAKQQGPSVCRQIEDMLASRDWFSAARFASYACQDAALKLRPWEAPPCWLRTDDPDTILCDPGPDPHNQRRAAELLDRLLSHGLSRFEPDVLAALAAAEAKTNRVM